jgi:type IV pilus assembly protein PilB
MNMTTVEPHTVKTPRLVGAMPRAKRQAGPHWNDRTILRIVREASLLPEQRIAAAIQRAELESKPVAEVLSAETGITEERLTRALAKILQLPFVGLAAMTLDSEAIASVPEELCRKHTCLPVRKDAGAGAGPQTQRPTMLVAMADPTDLDAVQDMEFASGCSIRPILATPTEIRDALDRHCSPEKWLRKFLANVSDSEGVKLLTAEAGEEQAEPSPAQSKAPVVKMVNLIIQHAIQEGASDIHVEPNVNDMLVRTRHEGMLREFLRVPKWLHEPLVSRLKILAHLDIAERRRPQDGRIRVSFEDREIDLRVATLPTYFGEKVVLRILDGSRQLPSLEAMCAEPAHVEIIRNAASQPQGMILVTGPTGSGKTTTLYAILNERRDPAVNIVTVEDPIELQLPGINQVQVNQKAGVTFATCLRSILRQDPNIILIGEIRDLETAEIAFHAAATGHLVMSTLHTNSTLATVSRLFDLGLDPFIVSSCVNLILAQRLIRRICDQCREEYTPAADVRARLRLQDAGFQFFRGRGCAACGQTGYSGRIAVQELLRMTPQLQELINRKASEAELRAVAIATGTQFLLDQALEKVKQGVTTVEEVLRVIQLNEEQQALACPRCRTCVGADFTFCPNCLFAVRTMCQSCDQELKPEWRACPYCQTPACESAPAPACTPPAAAPGANEPLAPGQAGQLPPPACQSAPVKRPRILVVDDDELSRYVAVKALRGLPNADIFEAASGPEALELVGSLRPDLLILDVMMPGMSGLEVCQKLRSNLPTAFIPILMLTGSVDEDSRTKGFLVGTDDYMGKPFSVPELHARVSRLLRRTYGI